MIALNKIQECDVMEKQKASTIFLHVCERSRQQASAPATSDELNSIMKGGSRPGPQEGPVEVYEIGPRSGWSACGGGERVPSYGHRKW